MGKGRVGVIMAQNLNTFHFNPPHPTPLPQGERRFPDGNDLAKLKGPRHGTKASSIGLFFPGHDLALANTYPKVAENVTQLA